MNRRSFLTALVAIPLAFLNRWPRWASVIKTRVNPDLTKQFEDSNLYRYMLSRSGKTRTAYNWKPEGGSIRNEELERHIVALRRVGNNTVAGIAMNA